MPMRQDRLRYHRVVLTLVGLLAAPPLALAQDLAARGGTIRDTGVSGLWILANLSYAGMRAQNSRSGGWRIIAFVFGFPGTLLSLLFVHEGSERAYGVELPRRRSAGAPGHKPA